MSYIGSVPDVPRAADWRDFAACRQEEPRLFFPDGSTGPWLLVIEQAKAVCGRCPAVDWCLQWALETGQESGIWGGLSEDERRAMKRRGRARPRSEPEDALVFTKTGTLADQCRDLYDRYTEIRDGGHLVWTAPRIQVRLHGRDRTFAQISFQAGHGRWPDGPVKRSCDVWRCVAPGCLTDKTIRSSTARCGTRSGYQRHRSLGEEACGPCKAANTDADNRLRRTGTTKAAV